MLERDLLQLCDSQTTDGHWKFLVLNCDHLRQLHQDLILGQHWIGDRKSNVRRVKSCILHRNPNREPESAQYEPLMVFSTTATPFLCFC